MNVLFEASLLLRWAINSCTKWVFSVITQYEFSLSSEVFVCTDGKMLHYFAKSALMTILEKVKRLVVNQSKERPLVLRLVQMKE